MFFAAGIASMWFWRLGSDRVGQITDLSAHRTEFPPTCQAGYGEWRGESEGECRPACAR